MDISGAVLIRLPDTVQVCRPAVAETLFGGRSAAQVVEMVPMLYSLCAQAQQAASRLALFGDEPDQRDLRTVALEAVREQGLFLARWLPELTAALRGIAGWQNLDKAALSRHFAAITRATGDPPVFLKTANLIAEKMPQKAIKTAPQAVLSHFEQDFALRVLQNMVQVPGWCAQPVLDAPRENSAYTRAVRFEDFSPDVKGRLAARLWDLHQWMEVALGASARFPLWGVHEVDGWRLGWVETARGRLYHAARVEADQVVAYRISAPTEWNFHPQGVLARWLSAVDVPDRETAQVLAQLIDPCVAVRIEEV